MTYTVLGTWASSTFKPLWGLDINTQETEIRAGDSSVPGRSVRLQSPVGSSRKLDTAGGRTRPTPLSLLTTPHRCSQMVSFSQCRSAHSEAAGARSTVGLGNPFLFLPIVCSCQSSLLTVAFLLHLERKLQPQ